MGGPGSGPTAKANSLHHGEPTVPTARAAKGKAIKWPRANGDWHPLARDWYEALKVSGQKEFYEQSDVAIAVHAAEVCTIAYARASAPLFAEFSRLADALLSTAAMRKRMRIELAGNAPPEAPSVAKVEKYKVIAGTSA